MKKMYIAGEWIEAEQSMPLISPYNLEEIAKIPVASKNDIEKALEVAFQQKNTMVNLPAHERATILEKVAKLFRNRRSKLAQTMASENGKPLNLALGEVDRAIQTYKFSAEEAKRLSGETIPLDAAKGGEGRFGYTQLKPLGVIVAITPFNFPLNLVAHKLGPAIASGNSVILKPASQTPLTAFMTAKIFEEAGLPKGVLNVVTGQGSLIGDLLVKDHRVNLISFTGSYEVGMHIKRNAGLKKVILELGSNSPVIVEDTNNIDEVITKITNGSFNYSGQICISVQRVYVNEEISKIFVDKLVQKTKTLKIGSPTDVETDVSAIINPNEADRIIGWIEEVKQSGGIVAVGGKKYSETIIEPTVILNAPLDSSVSCKEIFGPVVVVNTYSSWEKAIDYVNDSDYGLQAGVFTESITKAFDAINRIEAGGVLINEVPTFRVDHMPYGGIKKSGTGKEGVKYAVESMTEIKFASITL